MMTVEPLIINTALSHAADAEIVLAAYSVMFGISLVIEAPVLMLVSASTALSQTRDAFRKIFRFTLILGAGSVTVGFLVALTPLYGWLVLDLMHIPPAVAEATRPALVIMSLWSLPVAWRRTLQGVLIANNRTPLVTMATIVRLIMLVAVLYIGARLMPDRMLIVSAIALQAAVITEALVVTRPAFRLVQEIPPGPGEDPLTWRSLISFYQPLAVMMVLRQISRPMLSAGIAAAQRPQLSLAAWSVAWSLVVLPFGVTMGLEQVAIAKGTTAAALGQVRRFSWVVGLVLSAALLLIAFTPLAHPVLDALFDLSAEIKPLVITALRWTALLPLLQSLQALLRGIAIDRRPVTAAQPRPKSKVTPSRGALSRAGSEFAPGSDGSGRPSVKRRSTADACGERGRRTAADALRLMGGVPCRDSAVEGGDADAGRSGIADHASDASAQSRAHGARRAGKAIAIFAEVSGRASGPSAIVPADSRSG